MQDNRLPPIEDLLPHRGTMLLLERVLAFTPTETRTETTPNPLAWYADTQGNMPAWIGIELMAQTIAAHVGLQKRRLNHPPKQGVLLGTRHYHCTPPSFAGGQTLYIHAALIYQDESGLAAYQCHITQQDKVPIAHAALKVFEPTDFQVFHQGN
ncbi:MAG: beta-hydroxyacyl-ACP dehydratase [Ottowia sp.]|jgi:predicted hotdog family 3-hydroxylacyl-ACP dehydratase|nr:beta-hydroxyacyl-ACP dehydratase [Ottowia sp.]